MNQERHDRLLIVMLRVVGVTAILAFAAAIMPARWMIEVAQELGINDFPDAPLTFYLARNLSLLYGYVGALLLIVAADLNRYRPLLRWIVWGTISFGCLQLVVDAMAGMPAWWTLGEGFSTVAGGVLLWILTRSGLQASSSND